MTAGQEAPRFVVVGDVFNDIVAVPRGPLRPDTDTMSTIRPRPGGSGANTAAWLGVLGNRVDLVASVGSDAAAQHEAVLRDAGVVPHFTVEHGVPTGTLVSIVEGQQRSMLTDRGASSLIRPEHVRDELLAGAAALHISGYTIMSAFGVEGAQDLIGRAAALGVPVAVNCNSTGYMIDFGVERFVEAVAGVTILVANHDEGRLLTGLEEPEQIAVALLEQVPVAVLTLSDAGSVVAERGGKGPILVPAQRVRMLDPTGAGDAYAAGFLSAWAAGGPLAEAAELGSFTAARAIVVYGSRPPV